MTSQSGIHALIQSGEVDFGRQSAVYAELRPGFPDTFYARLRRLLDECKIGADDAEFRVLDLGTGPGIVALRFAQLFPKARVTGVDISEDQVAAAKARAAQLGLSERCSFATAKAESTGLPDAHFDVVLAGQCWPWFDGPAAAKEARRVLRRGGMLVVCQFCYLPKRSEAARDTEALILKYNPTWTMHGFDGLYPQQVDQLVVGAGFELVEQFCYDHLQPFSHRAWVGRMRTCNGVGSGKLSEEQVKQWTADLEALLRRKYPAEPVNVWHRVWAVAVRNL